MHERKQLMYDLADGFVALPGGLGTLEELAEVLTWNQLGILAKPVAILDVGGFWDGLVHWLTGAVEAGFVPRRARGVAARGATSHVTCSTCWPPPRCPTSTSGSTSTRPDRHPFDV